MGAPLWMIAVVGGLALGSFVPTLGRTPGVPGPPRASGIDLAEAPARLLERLPGIGARRSRELVEARWERAPSDPPLYLSDLPGLGADVERRVRAWLERAGVAR